MSLRCLLADSDEDELPGKTQEDDITENTDSTEAEAQLLLSIALVSPPLPQSPTNDKEHGNGNESFKSPTSASEHAIRHLEESLPTPATSSPCSSDTATAIQRQDDSQHRRNPQHHSSSFSSSHRPLTSTNSKSNTNVNTSRQKDNATFPRQAATNPTIPNMVILKDLNELDTGMVCEYVS